MNSHENSEQGAVTLRRSCHFCRSRKIRCSGEAICEQCKLRNLVCMYGVEGSKGRPKDSVSSALSRRRRQKSSANVNEIVRDNAPSRHGSQSISSEGWGAQSGNTVDNTKPTDLGNPNLSNEDEADTDMATDEDSFVSQQLEELFQKYFGRRQAATPSTPSTLIDSDSLVSLTGTEDQADHEHKLQLLKSQHAVSYADLFHGLAPSLVQLISSRFGSLGFCNENDRTTYFLARQIRKEIPTTILDAPQDSEEAMPEVKDHRIQQLIDVWFFHHPLSFMLSKTLFIYDYRNGALNKLLLAVILADASSELEGESGTASQGEALFTWIHSQLPKQSVSARNSLPLVQVLVLMGWHDMFTNQACRGFCYIILAWKMIVKYQTSLKTKMRGTIDRINGLDVSEIKLELSQRIYWFTFALTLWASLQMEVPFSDILDSHLDVEFPSTDGSAVFKLDVESGNISTLRVQERAARELWPLGHITSTVASVYALYPHVIQGSVPATNECWTSGTLLRLRNLLNGESTLSGVCNNVRTILSDGVEQLMTQDTQQPAHAFVLTAYHTMIVHFLFPSDSNVLTSESIVDKIIQSVGAYEQVLRSISNGHLGSSSDAGNAVNVALNGHSAKDNSSLQRYSSMIVLGIDACSRALRCLADVSEQADLSTIKAAVCARGPEIATSARNLHAVCKHPTLRAVPAAAAVKRSLRRTRQVFQVVDDPMSASGHKRPWSVGSEFSISQNVNVECARQPELAPAMTTDDLMAYDLLAADIGGVGTVDDFGAAVPPLDTQNVCQLWTDQCGKPLGMPDDGSRPGSSAALMGFLPHTDGMQVTPGAHFNMMRSASEGHWGGQW